MERDGETGQKAGGEVCGKEEVWRRGGEPVTVDGEGGGGGGEDGGEAYGVEGKEGGGIDVQESGLQ